MTLPLGEEKREHLILSLTKVASPEDPASKWEGQGGEEKGRGLGPGAGGLGEPVLSLGNRLGRPAHGKIWLCSREQNTSWDMATRRTGSPQGRNGKDWEAEPQRRTQGLPAQCQWVQEEEHAQVRVPFLGP